MRLFILLFTLLKVFPLFAQPDTVYTYFDANKKPAQPANAVYISKVIKDRERWHKQVFVRDSEHLYMDGYYADEKTHIPDSVMKYYGDCGQVIDSCFFIGGQLKSKYTFYPNSQVKNYILFTDSINVAEQGGYTADGYSIDNYIAWRPAMYPDGTTDWQKYLRKKMNWHLPAGYRAGLMEGNVEISFIIDTTGAVTNAAIVKKSGFIDLDQRALAIIEKSSKWIPAMQNNQLVPSTQKQTIVFANNEVNAQANKTITRSLSFFNWMTGL